VQELVAQKPCRCAPETICYRQTCSYGRCGLVEEAEGRVARKQVVVCAEALRRANLFGNLDAFLEIAYPVDVGEVASRRADVGQCVRADLVQSERGRHLDCLATDPNCFFRPISEHVKARHLAQHSCPGRRRGHVFDELHRSLQVLVGGVALVGAPAHIREKDLGLGSVLAITDVE
jgi:hypothetical protein